MTLIAGAVALALVNHSLSKKSLKILGNQFLIVILSSRHHNYNLLYFKLLLDCFLIFLSCRFWQYTDVLAKYMPDGKMSAGNEMNLNL